MNYQTHTLPNGIKLIFKPEESDITYCGLVVNTGSRDETELEYGMAHFVEHMLFKGTEKKSSWQIINKLEHVGGELNAFTSKEETVVYATVLTTYAERAMELIADVVLNSNFPQKEIDKEVVIVIDEIQSYNDSPSELIYDDFEDIIFHDHALGHNILGEEKFLQKFTTTDALAFVNRQYQTQEMVFFIMGKLRFEKVIRWAEKYLSVQKSQPQQKLPRLSPTAYHPQVTEINKSTHQIHYMLGNRSYHLHHPDRMAMYLLNNILGGPGMNSRLNLALREKNGLVYHVDSSFQPFTDTGAWYVYFGCDPENLKKCERLVMNELSALRDKLISEIQLNRYKLQLMGQMAIASEQKENLALSLGKSYLRYGKIDDMQQIKNSINSITALKLQEVAQDIFNPECFSILKYI